MTNFPSAELLLRAVIADGPDERIVNKFGTNPLLLTGVTEDIINMGGSCAWPASDESWELVSSSVNDAAAGTGAQKVIVEYLDENFEELTTTVTLNGTTPVVVAPDGTRLNRMFIDDVGSNDVNEGTITLRVSGGGAARGIIIPDSGQTRRACYTVPVGFLAYIVRFGGGIYEASGGTPEVEFELMTRDAIGKSWRVREEWGVSGQANSYVDRIPAGAIDPVAAGGMVRIRGTATASNIAVGAYFGILLVATP